MLLRKWSLPVLAALRSRAVLGAARGGSGRDPRALALALKDLQAAELVERRIEDAYPPRALYVPTAQGRRLQRIVA